MCTPKVPIICTCGYDGKLTSPLCPLHGERELTAQVEQLLEALGGLVSKPVPFCDEGSRLVCPYCDCTEHPDNCEWLQAQHVWVDIKNRIFREKEKV